MVQFDEKLLKKMTPNQAIMIGYFQSNPVVEWNKVADDLNLSYRAVMYHKKQLLDMNEIKLKKEGDVWKVEVLECQLSETIPTP